MINFIKGVYMKIKINNKKRSCIIPRNTKDFSQFKNGIDEYSIMKRRISKLIELFKKYK